MKQTLLMIIKYLMVPLGIVYMIFKGKSNLTILLYHRVNDKILKELSVTNENFIWQMDYLFKKGYHVISLQDAIQIDWVSVHKNERYVVLTFDDGYEDFYCNAFPILSKYNYPSINYLVPGYIESDKVFWWDKDLGQSKLLNWEQVIKLKSSGIVDFGSHSMTHSDLNKLTKEELMEEIHLSQKTLGEKLTLCINHFSYPRGIVSPYALEIIKSIYTTAVSIFDGYEIKQQNKNDYMMKLKRMPVQRSDGRYLFVARLKGWLIIEEWIKRIIHYY